MRSLGSGRPDVVGCKDPANWSDFRVVDRLDTIICCGDISFAASGFPVVSEMKRSGIFFASAVAASSAAFTSSDERQFRLLKPSDEVRSRSCSVSGREIRGPFRLSRFLRIPAFLLTFFYFSGAVRRKWIFFRVAEESGRR